MTIALDVWSDYNCPWCFLASRSVEKLRETHDITVTWHSYELRPPGSPPMSAAKRAQIEQAWPRLQQMAREHYEVEINQGHFMVDSRPALIGAKFAEEQGQGNAYHQAVMSAYWEHARDIEDQAVLAEIAVTVGLDREAYLASLSQPDYEALVDTDILLATEMELNGVPALLFEHKYLIPGAQPYEELVKALAYVQQREKLSG